MECQKVTRPLFSEFESYEEFKKYYWYRDELIQICRDLQIVNTGSKLELSQRIEQYFKGHIINVKKTVKRIKPSTEVLTLDTSLVACGFCFNQKFRDFFIEQTKVTNFKFNADMVATAKKVKEDKDETSHY